ISAADAAFTNQHQVILRGTVRPIESLTLAGNYNLFWNQEKYDVSRNKTKGFVGHEIDLQANWDYTEDVSFSLLAAWFIPGEVYYDNMNDIATDLVGSVKVSF
ncbi:MAG: alginate export family protein, partial [Candidatus Omnitrophica bacterium]|nr:alginate export family protein [Candidatus Omnitrophota bacterium]